MYMDDFFVLNLSGILSINFYVFKIDSVVLFKTRMNKVDNFNFEF